MSAELGSSLFRGQWSSPCPHDMLCVVYDSSLFRGLVSCLPTESVLAYNAHYSDISTTLCNRVAGKEHLSQIFSALTPPKTLN